MKLVAALIASAMSLCAADYHIATNGTSFGVGSQADPWDITTGLQSLDVVPGSTIWVHGGTYGFGSNVYSCTMIGASNAPIIVRRAPGEWPFIDGGINAVSSGNWVTFWGLGFTCRNARTNSYLARPAGLLMSSRGHKAVNLVMQNVGHPAIGGGGSEIYGCLLERIGIYDTNDLGTPTTPAPRGSALYLQNSGVWEYEVRENISFHQINAGMKGYTQEGLADNFTFDGNVVFNNGGEGIEIDSLFNVITTARVWNNFTYHCLKTPMGYFADITGTNLFQLQSLIYSNNYEIGQPGAGSATTWFKRWEDLKVVNNTIATVSLSNAWDAGSGSGTGSSGKFIDLYFSTNHPKSYVFDNNAYYGGRDIGGEWFESGPGTNLGVFYHTYLPFRYNLNAVAGPADGTNGPLSFAKWQSTHGYDLNSTYTTNLPTTDTFTVLRTNKYERGRCHIIAINWRTNSSVNVNLSTSGLTNGQPFTVRDSQNYFGDPVYSNVFIAASPTISIPLTMTDMSPATVPLESARTHTESLFNVFVVTPVETMVTNAVASNFSARSGRGRAKWWGVSP